MLKIIAYLRNKKLLWVLTISAIYPAIVLSFVWYHCFVSDFQGGKNGQLDAYRHTLASAVVAYTLSPKAVSLVTLIIEIGDDPDNLMDRHNNAIGALIGIGATSLSQINETVIQHVKNGTENAADSNQITWLAKPFWERSLFW